MTIFIPWHSLIDKHCRHIPISASQLRVEEENIDFNSKSYKNVPGLHYMYTPILTSGAVLSSAREGNWDEYCWALLEWKHIRFHSGWRVLIAFWSFVWKTLLDDRPKPHVCKFHMKSANPWISMKFKIWICGFLSKNLQISLESADFSEIHSYLSDFNRETSKRKTTCIADNPLHLQDIVQRSLICVLLLVENMHNLATGCMLLRTNKIGITLRLNIRFL